VRVARMPSSVLRLTPPQRWGGAGAKVAHMDSQFALADALSGVFSWASPHESIRRVEPAMFRTLFFLL
jgi:hypothetical protein